MPELLLRRDHARALLRFEREHRAYFAARVPGGAVLVVVLGAFAVPPFGGWRVEAAPSMRLALVAGFCLLLAGLLSGAAMMAVGTVAMNTGTAANAYAVTGFLKGFHGVTLHAVLVLPATAWLLAPTSWAERRRVQVMAVTVAAYVAAATAALAVNVLAM